MSPPLCRVSSKTSIMPSGATQRSDTKVLSSLKRNAPGRWPIERHHACPSQRVQSNCWSVNRKHCELESVAGLDFGAKHHAIGHVEALNGSRTGIAAPARHLAIDPDLRIIVDQDVE